MFSIDESTTLHIVSRADAAQLFALTEANRAYLRRWLPWVDAVTDKPDTEAYIDTMIAQREAGRGPTFCVTRSGSMVGIIGFRPVDRFNRVGEIGYWLVEAEQGRGTMTACCRFVVGYGFRTLHLIRIEIAAGVENRRSRAIPERLGFHFEGILRGRENLNGVQIDHAMYALLREEHEQAR